jgi:transcriptional regulator with XRE-family HTH domain
MKARPGEELRRLRQVRGLTLRELAKRVAFDHSYLAAVERGDRPGSPLLVASVDDALDARGRLIALFAVARTIRHTVISDDDVLRQSGNLAELMRQAGVVELPDYGTARAWRHTGTGPGWERHDEPEQQH